MNALEIEWSSLEFKNQLKTHDFLVISKNDNYASIIQVKKLEEFKDVKLRKFLIIPVNEEPVKLWVDEIKKEIGIKGEAKPEAEAKPEGVVKQENTKSEMKEETKGE